ncbi:phenylacetate--CoA ligase [Amylibacter sp. SFDW26]|uniref:phenylacetate--CoA ligase family protein n=1 Tax=Amylibacter sp. SFDW26 TaxID=2652722 RepID=UPI001262396A|nr:AMP-binding protein [Amylibacter sp. SFDW26]KAB7613993.1 phenylacetate--CoA ligase [Amylibacter sp. SFDW26]
MGFYDTLETRSDDERAADFAKVLPVAIANAKMNAAGFAESFADINPDQITCVEDLVRLPVLRKSGLSDAQKKRRPLGGYAALSMDKVHHVFQSPGPIYEMGQRDKDWWRFGRFLNAAGIGIGDIIQNTFSYHFTPAGMMFENAAAAVGATIIPTGPGQTELQALAAADLGVTAYAGTPDYLGRILGKGDELGLDLSSIRAAVVSGGPLFPQMRQAYQERGIQCLQAYGTAELGNIAYETSAMEGLIVDEGVIVEIVIPGTGKPVANGEIGEVVVTSLNADFPLIRFSTGDLSAVMTGKSPCGRTNMRIVGWRGRADQATKVKGMFVRPEQVATLVERHPEVSKARIEVDNDGKSDIMRVKLETNEGDCAKYQASIKDILKLRSEIEICALGSLPKDGLVIHDLRDVN